MTTRNPKQAGSNVFDCKPQAGPCPIGCSNCLYNRPGAFYVDPGQPHMPSPEEVGDGIMRVNSGHDSNIERDKVIAETAVYPRRFFNTSILRFDFPGPVVFTANRKEEEPATLPGDLPGGVMSVTDVPDNLMFVRLRTSATNLDLVEDAVREWTADSVPVVITFMAYYTAEPAVPGEVHQAVAECGPDGSSVCYVWQKRTSNSYWCATELFRRYVLARMKRVGGRLVSGCGRLGASKCVDCRNCETYFLQTLKHMEEVDGCA